MGTRFGRPFIVNLKGWAEERSDLLREEVGWYLRHSRMDPVDCAHVQGLRAMLIRRGDPVSPIWPKED